MDDLLEKIFGLIVLITLLISPFAIFQGFYICDKKLDKSNGVVYCDGQEVYKGRLYRFDKSLETDNLQAPMFSVRITDADNMFKTEKRVFCKDLSVKELKDN